MFRYASIGKRPRHRHDARHIVANKRQRFRVEVRVRVRPVHRGTATAGSALRASVFVGGTIRRSRALARSKKSVLWATCRPFAHRRTVSMLRPEAFARSKWFSLVMVRIVSATGAAVNGRGVRIARKFLRRKR